VFAKNVTVHIHGITPFQAVFGRYPRVLADFENASLSSVTDDYAGVVKHANRLREICLQQIISGIAADR
jgi:hypothetical protein